VGDNLSFRVESGVLPPDGRRLVRPEVAQGEPKDVLDSLGSTPLPPYIRRPDRPGDRERYQTVYARERGSVAAPTAGLHFTEELLARLGEAGILHTEVLLHVGHGTFQPVKVDDVALHRVAPEAYLVPPEAVQAIEAARARGGRVVAVGTTVTRTLETAAAGGAPRAGAGETDLVIVPGHAFGAIDGLVTNFHLPRSSLLLLVCAFAGRERVLRAYAEAISRGYRFYSYGDAMLVL
jgi:S-adenosylmethionine:tRNA ribosyltransferase-isomerase